MRSAEGELDGQVLAERRLIRSLFEYRDAMLKAMIIGLALVLAWWTWASWGDIQIDCGRELYVPMEILRGRLLYRDIWYPYGPLMPYIEAALLATFGPHLLVFYAFGLITTIGCALLLYRIGAMLQQPVVGFTAALGLLLQGFAPNFMNFIFPYSYAASFALFLALLCALLVLRHIVHGGSSALVIAGVAAGLTLLCKPEIGEACYAILAGAALLDALAQRSAIVLIRKAVTSFPGLIIAAAIYAWFVLNLSPALVLENWIGPPGPYFFRRQGRYLYGNAGFRFDPIEVGILVAAAMLSVGLWYGIARALRSRSGRMWLAAGVGLQISLARVIPPFTGRLPFGAQLLGLLQSMLFYPKSMFFIGLMAWLAAIYRLVESPRDRLALALAAYHLFAISCALRVFTQIVPFGYAIFYAPPLFLSFLLCLAEVVDHADVAVNANRPNAVNVIMTAEVLMLLFILFPGPSERTAKFTTSWGSIYVTPEEARVGRQITEFILNQKQERQRVVVLPEGPMFYAITETEAPDRWYTFLPGFRSPDQQRDYVSDLRRANPKYVVLTDRSFQEYGTPRFGVDFDQIVYRWILSHYHVINEFGQFEAGGGSGGLAALVYERND